MSTDFNRKCGIKNVVLNIEFIFGTYARVVSSHPIGSLIMELSGAREPEHTNGILVRNITSIAMFSRLTAKGFLENFSVRVITSLSIVS